MPNNTDRIGLPYILQSQSQKEVTHNDGLGLLDMLVQAVVQQVSLNTPPASPVLGDCYIVGGAPTGVWVGSANKIAQAITGGWRYYTPFNGLSVFNITDSTIYRFNGTAWVKLLDVLQNLSMLGINATADSTNKLSVNSSAILFNHIGNGVQVKLNKNAVGDSGSFLFQSNWSGRAEIGLTGDDDFHFKVSPDGSTWYDALVINRNNGKLESLGISFDGGTNNLQNYQEWAETALTGDVWTGTAPSGAANKFWKAIRVGKKVTVFFRIEYATAGATNTSVTIPLPAGLPTPETWTGQASELAYHGTGGLFTSAANIPTSGTPKGVTLRYNGTAWEFGIHSASGSHIFAQGTIEYMAA